MVVESGSVEDVEAVADLWVSLAAEQRRYGSRVEAEPNRPAIRDTVSRYAATDRLLVARNRDCEDGSEGENGDETGDSNDVGTGDRVVGFVTFDVETGLFSTDRVAGVVEHLSVASGSRNRGVGGDLLAAAERELADRGADAVVLEVLADNEDARRFYRRHGYGVHRVGMEKSLK